VPGIGVSSAARCSGTETSLSSAGKTFAEGHTVLRHTVPKLELGAFPAFKSASEVRVGQCRAEGGGIRRRLRGRPCGMRPDDESSVPEEACAAEDHPRHHEVLDGLDEGGLSRADQVGEARMQFSPRCGVQRRDVIAGHLTRWHGTLSLFAARIPKEKGKVRCLVGVDVPHPIQTAMAHVYGGVLAWDEVAENMAAGACIAKGEAVVECVDECRRRLGFLQRAAPSDVARILWSNVWQEAMARLRTVAIGAHKQVCGYTLARCEGDGHLVPLVREIDDGDAKMIRVFGEGRS